MAATRPRSTGHPGYSETHPCIPATAAPARRLARTACATWGVEQVAEQAELVISELVSNAVRHTNSRSIRVIVDRPTHDVVYVAVVDKAALLVPVLTVPAPGAWG